MKRSMLATMFILCLAIGAAGQMSFIDDPKAGTMTIRDGKADVLVYRYGDQLKEGVDPKFTRSGYIHPLYGLDGQVLTDDFPADHFHHHGLFWAWPVVKTRDVVTGNWEVQTPPLRQRFIRWAVKTISLGVAELAAENEWILGVEEKVARENVLIRVWPAPAEAQERQIYIQIVLEAFGGPLELQGAPDQNKGYGGLCVRGSPLFTGAVMTTDKGILKADVVNTPFRWAGLSAKDVGLTIEILPEHPGPEVPWLIRNSYGGVLNPSWPGLKPAVLKPGEPVRMSYRLRITRGAA